MSSTMESSALYLAWQYHWQERTHDACLLKTYDVIVMMIIIRRPKSTSKNRPLSSWFFDDHCGDDDNKPGAPRYPSGPCGRKGRERIYENIHRRVYVENRDIVASDLCGL